jgi:hypothetical protein
METESRSAVMPYGNSSAESAVFSQQTTEKSREWGCCGVDATLGCVTDNCLEMK